MDRRPPAQSRRSSPAPRGRRPAWPSSRSSVDRAGRDGSARDRVRGVVAGKRYAPYLIFEPGGQVELSLRPRAATWPDLAGVTRALAALAADWRGRHPPHRALDARAPAAVPATTRWSGTSTRSGRQGRRMMRPTASTQVCLDWWPGPRGSSSGGCSCSPGRSWRLRSASAGRTARYLARGRPRPHRVRRPAPAGGRPRRGVRRPRRRGARLRRRRAGEHLTTLFPPVRPRAGYLEVRFPDARRRTRSVAGLRARRARVRRRAAPRGPRLPAGEQHRLAEHWAAQPHRAAVPGRGQALLGLARRRWRHERPARHRPTGHARPRGRREHRPRGRRPRPRVRRPGLHAGGPVGPLGPRDGRAPAHPAGAAAPRGRPPLAGRR